MQDINNKDNPSNWFEWKNYILKFLENQTVTNEEIKRLLKNVEIAINSYENKNEATLKDISDLREKIHSLEELLQKVVTEVALLKLKSGLWGATAAAIVVVFLYIKNLLV